MRRELIPATCSSCGGSRVVRVLWRCVFLCGQDKEDVDEGRAILGSLGTVENGPPWVCLTCAPDWEELHRLVLQDYQWQDAKIEAVAAQQFEQALELRRLQDEQRRAVTELRQKLLRSVTQGGADEQSAAADRGGHFGFGSVNAIGGDPE